MIFFYLGPPVPPRPPKTLAVTSKSNPLKEPFLGPKINEPIDDDVFVSIFK